jgi:hypothetical protein
MALLKTEALGGKTDADEKLAAIGFSKKGDSTLEKKKSPGFF